MHLIKKNWTVGFIISLLLYHSITFANNPPPPATKVFKFSVKLIDPNTFALQWKILNGYFLYKERIYLSGTENKKINIANIRFPNSENYKDNLGKEYDVYRGNLAIPVDFLARAAGEVQIEIHYQGCSDTGFCYPPQCYLLTLNIDQSLNLNNVSIIPKPVPARIKSNVSEQDQITQIFFTHNLFVIIVIFFGLGVLLAFTPCILPMIPVLSGIIVGHGKKISTRKAFWLSLTYVLSMSITYAIVGAIIALFGANMQIAMQSPWTIVIFAFLFVLLALSMFDLYNFRLPLSWQNKLASFTRNQNHSHFINAAIMGSLSILILSPCVTPPLIGALGYISQTGNLIIGATALFFLSFGMGLPLLLIGSSAGKLLPHAGHWMEHVKTFFGFVMLAMAIALLARILPIAIIMLLTALLMIYASICLGIFEKADTGGKKLAKGIAIILFIYAVLLLIGASQGSNNLFQPLKFSNNAIIVPTNETTVKTLAEAKAAIKDANGIPIVLDFYADWCTSCGVLEKTVLKDPKIVSELEKFKLIRVDLSNNNKDSQDLLNYFHVVAPPTFLFFNSNGKEISSFRLVGEFNVATLYAHLQEIDRNTQP